LGDPDASSLRCTGILGKADWHVANANAVRAVEYSAYSLAKGQRMHDAVHILLDLFARRLYR